MARAHSRTTVVAAALLPLLLAMVQACLLCTTNALGAAVSPGSRGTGFGFLHEPADSLAQSERQAPDEAERPAAAASGVGDAHLHILGRPVETPNASAKQPEHAAGSAIADSETLAELQRNASFADWLRDNQIRSRQGRHLRNRGLTVLGEDDRVALGPEVMLQYPARAIGRLHTLLGTCTATIVGSRLVLTNVHCLGLVDGQLPDGFFRAAYLAVGASQGVTAYSAKFSRATWSSSDSDYALLQMIEPIGDTTGYPSFRWLSVNDFSESQPRLVSYIGYSGDILKESDAPGGHFGCTTLGRFTSQESSRPAVSIRHTCDTFLGASGAAIFEGLTFDSAAGRLELDDEDIGPFIVGLNWGESDNFNLMVPTDDLRSTFEAARVWPLPIEVQATGTSSSADESSTLTGVLYAAIGIGSIATVYFLAKGRHNRRINKTKATPPVAQLNVEEAAAAIAALDTEIGSPQSPAPKPAAKKRLPQPPQQSVLVVAAAALPVPAKKPSGSRKGPPNSTGKADPKDNVRGRRPAAKSDDHASEATEAKVQG